MEGAKDPVRIAKWTAIVAGSLLLLFAAGIFVLTSLIDPNRYRTRVEKIVADLAGRPLVIQGDLAITWFPWLGVRMGHAYLEDRPGTPQAPLAEWESVAVAAQVIPLLKGQIIVDRIRLQSPHIRLRRDSHGHGNWEDLGPKKSSGGASQPEIAGLEVRDGTVDYLDEASGQQISLSGLQLDIGRWQAGRPIDVSTRFIAHGWDLPPAGVPVELNVPQLALRTAPLNAGSPKITLRVADAKIDGDFEFDRTGDAHSNARGSADIHVPSVRKLAAVLALNQTMPHDPTTLGPLELSTRWSYTDGALSAKPISLKLDGVNFTGWVDRTAPPAAAWRFELHGDRIDLGRYVNVDSTSTRPFELPVEGLRAFSANGSVVFDQAIIADTRMSDVRLEFQTRDRTP